ncbi:MAG: metallophosphoesterase [Flavobacteriales bacterium]|nr:metallophosphoesterase [Flavobacteriales bacterium]
MNDLCAVKWYRPVLFVIALSMAGCSDPFDLHPWEVDVPAELKALHATTIPRIQGAVDGLDTFRFAVVGDPQLYYEELDEILDAVEAKGDIRFVIVAGDLTDQGLAQEFIWYAEVAHGRSIPVLSIIGNHDHLGSGRVIFEHLFGPRDFTFQAGGVRFICFDNVEFENELPVQYDELERQLEVPFQGPTIFLAHIFPGDVQLNGPPGQRFEEIMLSHPVNAAFMGHLHGYAVGTLPGGTPWATAPWVRGDAFLEVSVRPDTVTHRLISLP